MLITQIDDPRKFTPLVFAEFVCQFMSISIDSFLGRLIIDACADALNKMKSAGILR